MQWFGRPLYGSVLFSDDAEFHERFEVGTVVPEAVKPILTDEVRRLLKASGELTVISRGHAIVVFDDNQRSHADVKEGGTYVTSHWLKPHDWSRFARAGIQVISALRKAEATTREERPTAAEVAHQVSQHRDGPELGSLLATELDQFLEQPPPRSVPETVAEASRSKIEPWQRLIGLVLCIIPAGLLVITWNVSGNDYQILLTMILGIVSAIGAGILFNSLHRRWRINSLLKRGRIAEAQITNVKRTETVITVERAQHRRYRVAFTYNVDGDDHEGTVRTYGDQTRRALKVRESGEQTRLLVNEAAPRRIFWIDGLCAE